MHRRRWLTRLAEVEAVKASACRSRARRIGNLTAKHGPRTLGTIVGQSWVVDQLRAFVAEPFPATFLFEGEMGTGKTSAALALAHELGVDVDVGSLGGF